MSSSGTCAGNAHVPRLLRLDSFPSNNIQSSLYKKKGHKLFFSAKNAGSQSQLGKKYF